MTSPSLHDAPLERVTVLCQDVPYPPTHGGKVDLWNLLQALRSLGQSIQLVCWYRRDRIQVDVRQQLQRVAADIVELRRRDGWWRAFYPRYPPRMLSFSPSRSEFAALRSRVALFRPDWILLDHWIGFLPAKQLARETHRPLVYRSQNVEHEYYRELLRVARGVLRLKIAANLLRLKAAEREVRVSADLVADISQADAERWRSLGGEGRSIVVPPVWLAPDAAATHGDADAIDVLFVGNLRTPNNLEGLRWFQDSVLPVLRAAAGHPLTIVVAGSEPSDGDAAIWRDAGIQCLPNPPEVQSLYARARTIINPVRRGSGVNLKMIEAFASGRPIVSTAAGAHGLPDDVRAAVAVTATADEFASALAQELRSAGTADHRAERAPLIVRHFGTDNVAALLGALRTLHPIPGR